MSTTSEPNTTSVTSPNDNSSKENNPSTHVNAISAARLAELTRASFEVSVVYRPVEDKDVKICLSVDGLSCNLNREPESDLGSTLKRITLKLNKPGKANRKDKRQKILSTLTAQAISNSGDVIPESQDNKTAWQSTTVLRLIWTEPNDQEEHVQRVQDLTVCYNPPQVVGVSLSCIVPMIDCPIVPTVTAPDDSNQELQFKWFRVVSEDSRILIGESRAYLPQSEDVGFVLECVVRPKSGNHFGAIASSATLPVEFAPPPMTAVLRNEELASQQHLDLGVEDSKRFRLLTYNILADCYASQDYARESLFSYCNPNFLKIEYRSQLTLRELLAQECSIICLQECDKKNYHRIFDPVLTHFGFSSHFTNKGGSASEGCAIFVQNSRFQIGDTKDVLFKELLASHEPFSRLFEERPELFVAATQNINTIAQLVWLKGQENESIVVVNTHLFFHPDAHHIRAMQATALLHFLEQVVTPRDSIILCGDLNSVRYAPVPRLLQTGRLAQTDYVWRYLNKFKWGVAGETVEEGTVLDLHKSIDNNFNSVEDLPVPVDAIPELTHSFEFESATGELQYTNFVPGFKEEIDYVFCQRGKFEVLRVGRMPDVAVLAEETALPSSRFPSDHISLVVDLRVTTHE